MPRSATGRSTESRTGGFTLLELLAVIAIMAVLLGLVVISMDDRGQDRDLREHGQRLAALLTIAREEVMLGAPETALGLSRHAYHFLREQQVGENEREWLDIPADRTLRSRDLHAEGIAFELEVEGRPVRLDAEPETPAPNILLSPGGEMTPFVLTILDDNDPDRRIRLEGEMDGSMELRRPGSGEW